MNIKKFIKQIVTFGISLFLWPVKYIVPKGNVIILRCNSLQNYSDNSRFLFEYLSFNTSFEVYWVTENKLIMDYLKGKQLKFITRKNPFHFIWVALRAKIVVDTGTAYFNEFGLSDNRKTTKICIGHGAGLKFSNMRTNNIHISILPILQLNKFDYVNYTSEFQCRMVGKKQFLLPTNKIINLGSPRCDSFFDKAFVENRYKSKIFTKELNKEYKKGGKIILYTPTWRPYSFNFPLIDMQGFNIKIFNSWLEEENIFFFYTLHNINMPKNIPLNLSRFIFIDYSKKPLYDINLFMHEVDILINDYSTTSTDFALSRKPQIFFMPDYGYYNEEKGFVEDYKALLPGKEVQTYGEFSTTIKEFLSNPELYLTTYKKQIETLIQKYNELSNGSSAMSVTKFIKKIIESPHKVELNDTNHLKNNVFDSGTQVTKINH